MGLLLVNLVMNADVQEEGGILLNIINNADISGDGKSL